MASEDVTLVNYRGSAGANGATNLLAFILELPASEDIFIGKKSRRSRMDATYINDSTMEGKEKVGTDRSELRKIGRWEVVL